MLEQLERIQKDFLSNQHQPSLLNLDAEPEYVTLPSKGYFYSGKYKNVDKLLVRKLFYYGEYLLTTPSYHTNNTLFDELLKVCIMDKEFPVLDIVDVDKQTILLWLKIGAFGTEHKTFIECPHCTKKVSVIWDFGELVSPDYPIGIEKELRKTGTFTTITPKGKFEVKLAPRTRAKSLVLNDFLIDMVESTSKEKIITEKLLNSIISVTDDAMIYKGTEEVYSWLKKKRLSMQDSRFLQNEIKKIDLKIDTLKEVTCPDCNDNQKVEILFDNNFFGLGSEYRKYLDESINHLVFWGRQGYDAALNMPTKKRIDWVTMTKKNLDTLFPKKK